MAQRWRAVAATLLIAAACAVVAGAPSAAAATGVPITGVTSHRCLGVAGSTATSGAQVQLRDCTGAANQAWQATAAGELRLFDGARCLDAVGHGTQSGTQVQLYTCHGGANQRWRISGTTIVGVESGLCLDTRGGASTSGTPANLQTCAGRASQQWSVGSTDSRPPTSPSNPRVSNLTCNSVTFAWSAATDDVGVAFYDVYHDGQLMTSVSGTTLATGLTVSPGVTWGLYVNARDAAGNVSQASATVTITPPQCQADTQPPTTPTGLTASAAGTTVTLGWTASTDNVGVASYDVLRDGAKVATVKGAVSFTDSGLGAGTTYSYAVLARDAQGNASAPSSSVTVTTGAGCTDPVCGVTTVTTELDLPWGLLTLPDGTVLYTRRDLFDIVHLDPATGTKTSLGAVPDVAGTDGEGGVLGVEIAPTFASDHWLYIFHTTATDNRIVRIKVDNDRLVTATEQVLLSGILRNKYHNGGRLRFGPDGKLYASTGDAQNGDNAQKTGGLNGKVLRINPDGSIPSDNPFGNAVWSYGHRNPQGLAFDAQGRLWEQEFGNSVMDETNLIVRGGNYGWPACEGTTGSCTGAGFIAPKATYPVAQGSCSGIAAVRGALYIACERGTRMYRAAIGSDGSLTGRQQYFVGTYGRLRTIEPAPGGGLWLTTSNAGDKDSIPNNSNERILYVTLGG
ncbi:PQQ-dependent sugar dehydrogenase [Dactylosporangium sp. CS-047395]|uniref:PQQ-dependent sugar dehydrogenase n=1 Tax=Dactylosporangium sp. CS-047395 TaxID=3239936 RepID=UPI003D8BADA1